MYSIKSVSFAAFLLFVGCRVQAQYDINPNTVPFNTRSSWCVSQTKSCPLLCLQLPGESATTKVNNCDPKTLNYQCICGNGLQPNASEYSQTIPYFQCTEWGQQCVAHCGSDSTCQSACIQQHPCGAQNPSRPTSNSTTTSSATAASTDASSAQTSTPVVYNGLAGSTAGSAQPASSTNSAQTALNIGRSYGFGTVVAGLFAGFALAL